MKVNFFRLLVLAFISAVASPLNAAVTQTNYADAPTREYIFVENDTDQNYFVTPVGVLDPRMTGANRWTGLKYSGSGTIYQTSLGYIDNGYNTAIPANSLFDMWLTDAPASNLLVGMRCINWYSGCDMSSSMLPPAVTDSQGFYGVKVTSGGTKWAHGMMSDQFYHYLNNSALGQTFSMTINTCRTTQAYSASLGQRCQYMSSGTWYKRKVSYTKAAHLKFYATNSLAEIFINTDGTPSLGAGNSGCRIQVIGSNSGLACKVLTYTLGHNGVSDTSSRFFPALSNTTLASAIRAADLQFSLDGSSWKTVSGTTNYYNFNQMKGNAEIHLFFSTNFFKQMIALGTTGNNLRELLNFRFRNTTAPESGWYEFSTGTQLIFKPTHFSVSIMSNDYVANPTRSGKVGKGNPALDFDYIVTANGKTTADYLYATVTGPSQTINGKSWCIFSSADGKTRVPFPGVLSYTAKNGTRTSYNVGCDGFAYDINGLATTTPWTSGTGVMSISNIRFSIPMNDPQSLRTTTQGQWYGDVSASGEILIQAVWLNAR